MGSQRVGHNLVARQLTTGRSASVLIGWCPLHNGYLIFGSPCLYIEYSACMSGVGLVIVNFLFLSFFFWALLCSIISKSRPEFYHLQELLVSLFHCLTSLSFHLILAPGGCFDAFWWVFWFFFMKTRSQGLSITPNPRIVSCHLLGLSTQRPFIVIIIIIYHYYY